MFRQTLLAQEVSAEDCWRSRGFGVKRTTSQVTAAASAITQGMKTKIPSRPSALSTGLE